MPGRAGQTTSASLGAWKPPYEVTVPGCSASILRLVDVSPCKLSNRNEKSHARESAPRQRRAGASSPLHLGFGTTDGAWLPVRCRPSPIDRMVERDLRATSGARSRDGLPGG